MTQSSLIELSLGQVEDVRRAMHLKIEEGLAADGREILAFPAFVSPGAKVEGTALVIDTGGTNMRAAVVELPANGAPRILKGPVQKVLPMREGVALDGEEFFRVQAELARSIDAPAGLAVGYCFSYPSQTLPNLDARLTHWTKGINIPGVEGTLVGSRLGNALAQAGVTPRSVHVLNDTVASLLGGTAVFSGEGSKVIGVIVGTGTNMAGFFSTNAAPKLKSLVSAEAKMAVNLESGNFVPPHLTRFDDAVDAASPNPGRQRFEKSLSGYYLPRIFAEIMGEVAGFKPEHGARPLVEFRDQQGSSEAGKVAGALLARSADLIAAGLAGIIDHYEGADEVGILAEGSLIWGDPKYAPRVTETLERLLGGRRKARILRLQDANLIGSAVAALSSPPARL